MYRVARSLPLCVVALASFVVGGCGSGSDSGSAVNNLFVHKYACTASGCHDDMGSSAGFSMTKPGWDTAMVGGKPQGGGIPTFEANPNCAGMTYLDPGSNPASGLFMRKLTLQFGCGMQMPYIGNKVSVADLATIQDWANTLTK